MQAVCDESSAIPCDLQNRCPVVADSTLGTVLREVRGTAKDVLEAFGAASH